ncbi:hypothetical protein [Actinopolyspora mortivallis]|uniref:hypothetical protein n=1 Tax=Actinopolyspora mortivallis TaxID=33906 RepID=UPI0012EE2943|nr:hypothetical protein [Actinopolyspora mortivallis]
MFRNYGAIMGATQCRDHFALSCDRHSRDPLLTSVLRPQHEKQSPIEQRNSKVVIIQSLIDVLVNINVL